MFSYRFNSFPWNFSCFITRLNFKIIKCVFNFLTKMQWKNSISYILKNPIDFKVLKPCAYNLQSDIRAPRFIPKDLQVLETFNILDMIFYYHVKYSLINIEVGGSCHCFFLLTVLYYVIFNEFLPKTLNFLPDFLIFLAN